MVAELIAVTLTRLATMDIWGRYAPRMLAISPAVHLTMKKSVLFRATALFTLSAPTITRLAALRLCAMLVAAKHGVQLHVQVERFMADQTAASSTQQPMVSGSIVTFRRV